MRLFFEPIVKIAFEAPRPVKRVVQAASDSVIIFLVLSTAMSARLESLSFLSEPDVYIAFFITFLPTIYVFMRCGLYRAFLRHFSTEVAVVIAFGSAISAGIMWSAKVVFNLSVPISVPLIYAAFLFIAIAGTRFALRSMFRKVIGVERQSLAIYGAGAAGAQTFQSLKANPNYRVCMVIDDDVKIQGESLFGQRIHSFDEAIRELKDRDINTVLLAMPSVAKARRQSIITRLVDIGIKVKTIPGLSNLINNSAVITELQDIDIEDLLYRELVTPDAELMKLAINGKVVLVTGAGGSIGSELCRQIILWQPKRLIIFDQSEYAIYQLDQEIAASFAEHNISLTQIVSSVLDKSSIMQTLESFKVDTVYHVAAYKHVPLMEKNVMQCVKNNVFGTLNVAECAIKAGVTKFTLVSTDKAVYPTNIMGASKRLCELICQSLNLKQKHTCLSIVRFGNVLGSSGSVVPLFKKQIESGGPLTVTHRDVTRYFMTIQEAVQLVIQAGALAKGGEVHVLDMGKPIKIITLAKRMALLCGLRPVLEGDCGDGDIKIEVTGLRSGEKLFEELAYGDNLFKTPHPRINNAYEVPIEMVHLKKILREIEAAIERYDKNALHRAIHSVVPGLFKDID